MPEDHALTVLEKIRKGAYPNLSQALLRQCYEIQKKHQYERDELVALQELQRLVESEIDRQMESDLSKNGGS